MPVELFNIDEGYAVFSKGEYETARHSHYAIEIVCCDEDSFNITTNVSAYTNIKSAIIPSNILHSFSCKHAVCDLLFLDPLSAIGKYFLQQYNLTSQQDILIDPPGLNQFHTKTTFDISLMLKKSKTNCSGNIDPRISKCIEAMNALITNEKLTVAQLSSASFLSESRLAHLFKTQLGISVHQCILWKKILLTVLKSREGYSLTECAHYAGFSDSSHFYKVFYKMFGVKPFFVFKD